MSYTDSILRHLDSLKEQAKDALWAITSCAFKPAATVKVNGRTYKIVKPLGEGGFSFVYLAQDELTGREFALKKIRAHNSEAVKGAMREIEAYRRFKHPNIIRIYDSAVVQDPSGDGKIVYLFLPLFRRGNLQDAINSNTINNSRFSEKQMLTLFKGTCEAVRAMHDYQALVSVDAPSAVPTGTRANHSAHSSTATIRPEMFQPQPSKLKNGYTNPGSNAEDDEDEDDHSFPEPEGDAEGGYSYGGSVPLVTPKSKKLDKGKGRATAVFDGDEELERLNAQGSAQGGATYENGEALAPGSVPAGMKKEHVPYAHRDIKPGNIMLSDEGNPILMDFGSTIMARIYITTRGEALVQQDLAAEQSTMTFRAPELFDVKTGVILDEKVDIWSLGCTLYALAYNRSPFETAEQAGGSIAMAAMNGQYKHPAAAASAYSQGLRDLIDACMVVDPAARPDIHKVIELTEGVLRTLG